MSVLFGALNDIRWSGKKGSQDRFLNFETLYLDSTWENMKY